jgi:hypothetical protein
VVVSIFMPILPPCAGSIGDLRAGGVERGRKKKKEKKKGEQIRRGEMKSTR